MIYLPSLFLSLFLSLSFSLSLSISMQGLTNQMEKVFNAFFLSPSAYTGMRDLPAYAIDHAQAQREAFETPDNLDDFYIVDQKRMKWELEENDEEILPLADGTNVFAVFLRACMEDHRAECSGEVCRVCSERIEETFGWPERFRFGALAKKFEDQTLRQILEDKQWTTNPQPSTVVPLQISKKRDGAPDITNLRKRIEQDLKRRQANTSTGDANGTDG